MSNKCAAEMCPNWTGHGCICGALGLEPSESDYDPARAFNEAGWPKALEDDEPDDRNQKIIEFAYRLRREDEDEALMSGGPVILPELSEYLERAAAIVAADEANEAFGTTCVDCGRAIGDEDDTVPDEDGNLLHVGCGDRP